MTIILPIISLVLVGVMFLFAYKCGYIRAKIEDLHIVGRVFTAHKNDGSLTLEGAKLLHEVLKEI